MHYTNCMDIKISIKNELEPQQKVLVLCLFENDTKKYAELNSELNKELLQALERKSFSFEFGKFMSTKISNSIYERIIVFSLGKKEEITLEKVRRISGRILKAVNASKYESYTTNLAETVKELFDSQDLGRAVSEGTSLASYSFDKYLPENKKNKLKMNVSLQYSYNDSDLFGKGLKEGEIIAKNTNLARDLVNEPSNVLTPSALENVSRKIFSGKKNMVLKILNKKELKKLGMNTFLSVANGGNDDPRLIIIEYRGGSKSEKPTLLIGKGITFDSGGYNIKPTGFMEDMKCDMAGAAAVLSTINAVQELNLKKNIVGIIPTCENMISGSAYKPGDVIKTYSGKTVEIGNTDAEGRLILADALAYAEKNYSSEKMIDIATLTGASIIALGYYNSALMGNNDELVALLKHAGDISGDKAWPLPMTEDYMDLMDGDISDLNNLSKKADRAAGCITGGVFLSKFVEKTNWAHIDIGGSAYFKEAKEYTPKYATGAGVRLLTYFLMQK